MAIAISFVIGMILLYLFTQAAQVFPDKDIFEIAQITNQKWYLYLFLTLKTVLSLLSTNLVIGGYTLIVTRYLNPEGNVASIVIIMLVIVGFAATRNLLSVAYIVEFMTAVSIPFIAFIVFKTFTNPIFNFDSVFAVTQHYKSLPNLLTISSAAFLFSGYSHLGLFKNQEKKPLKFRYSWPAPVVVLVLLVITIFVPIGMLGTEASAQYKFVWSVATDATQMPYGFIERLMFIFIVVLLSVAVTYIVSTLSQVIDVIKRFLLQFKKDKNKKDPKFLSLYIYAIFAILVFLYGMNTNDFLFEELAKWYLMMHFIVETLCTIFFYIIVKVKGKQHEAKNS